MEKNYTTGQILKIAQFQKGVLWCILSNVIFILSILFLGIISQDFLIVVSFLIALIKLYFVYKLASALRETFPWLWCLVMVVPIPILTLLILLTLNQKATEAIQNKGFNVGLLGAKIQDIHRSLADS